MNGQIKDINIETLKQLILYSFKEIDEKQLTQVNLERWHKDLADLQWNQAVQVIAKDIQPYKQLEKGEQQVSGVFIASYDDGFKDNIVHHILLTDSKVVSIKDRGVSDLDFGTIYAFDCDTYTDQDGKTSLVKKKDTIPEETGEFTTDQLMKKLHKMKQPVNELKNRQMAVIEIKMTHQIGKIKDQNMWSLDTTNGKGFRFHINTVHQDSDDDKAQFLRLFFSPQKYGKQEFAGVIPEAVYEELNLCPPDDMAELILNWIVPRPVDLKYFAIGKVNISEGNEKYGESYALMPCAALIFDSQGQMPDFLTKQQTLEPEPEEEPEEAPEDVEDEDEEDLGHQLASQTDIKKYLKFNKSPDFTVEELNKFLNKKGLYATPEGLKKAQKDMGILEDKPKKKGKAKGKGKKKGK